MVVACIYYSTWEQIHLHELEARVAYIVPDQPRLHRLSQKTKTNNIHIEHQNWKLKNL